MKPIISWKALVERFRIQAREPVRALGAAMSESWERGGKEEEGKADRYRRDEKVVSAFTRTD